MKLIISKSSKLNKIAKLHQTVVQAVCRSGGKENIQILTETKYKLTGVCDSKSTFFQNYTKIAKL